MKESDIFYHFSWQFLQHLYHSEDFFFRAIFLTQLRPIYCSSHMNGLCNCFAAETHWQLTLSGFHNLHFKNEWQIMIKANSMFSKGA